MAPHSSTLAWKIPWMEELGGLQSMGSLRVGHDFTFTFTFPLSCIGEGNGNPLQCSCLENPRDRGAWWAAVYGVTQGRTRLKQLSMRWCLLRNLYAGQEATVRTGHGTTDWFQIGKGIHQGCILSPCLFNLHAECIMRNAGLDEAQAGVKIAGKKFNKLRYASTTSHHHRG